MSEFYYNHFSFFGDFLDKIGTIKMVVAAMSAGMV